VDRKLQSLPGHGRIAGLDGMRGVAAIIVLMHHVLWDFGRLPLLSEGYLSVDFFFTLSGFVIARGWEDRMGHDLSPMRFIKARISKLYPVMSAGFLLGAIVYLIHGAAPQAIFAALILQSLLIPAWWSDGPVFPLDGVEWSLFLEIAANLLHIALLRRLSDKIMWLFLVFMGAALIFEAVSYHSLGIGDRGPSFFSGIPRVLFSYTIGIALHRASVPWKLRRRAPPSWQAVAVMFTLVIIIASLTTAVISKAIVDLTVVMLVWPALIWLGSVSRVSHRSLKLAALLGGISFPLYAVHVPLLGVIELIQSAHGLGSTLCAALAVMLSLSGACLLHFAAMYSKKREKRAAVGPTVFDTDRGASEPIPAPHAPAPHPPQHGSLRPARSWAGAARAAIRA
jgi:peptidoglycan/LPS O-acetylase OafA/YrhL